MYLTSKEFQEQANINDNQFNELIINGFIKISKRENEIRKYKIDDDLIDKIKSGQICLEDKEK